MSWGESFSDYLSKAFRWQPGRQGTGYDKMLLFTALWPIPFDSYLLRYPGSGGTPWRLCGRAWFALGDV